MPGKTIKKTGAILDNAKNKRIKLERDLLLHIQQIFLEEKKLEDCLHLMLLAISKYINTEVAELWMPNYDKSELTLFSKYVYNRSLTETKEKTKFINGKCMIGKMWETKTPIVLDNLQKDKFFLRKKFAKTYNLNSAAAIPVIYKNNVIAGFCFLSHKKFAETWFIELSKEFLRILAGNIQRKKTEDEYEQFSNFSPDILSVCGLDGYFKKINPAAVKILGYTVKELKSKPIFDFIHPDDRGICYKELKKLSTGISSKYLETRYITKGGDVKLLSWTFELQKVEGLIYALGRDITDRRKLEKSIKSEQDRFSKMFSEAPVSMCILKGKDHVFKAANNQYYTLTKRNKSIIGKTVREVFPEVAAQGYYEWLDKVYNTGKTFSSVETPLKLDIHGNGILTDQYISFMYQPFKNEAGEVEGIFYFGVDVTEQVLTRKKIEESEELFRVIFQKAAAGVALVETNTGQHVRVNDKYCDIFGYTADELSTMTFMEFTHPEDLSTDLSNMKKLLDGEISEFIIEKRHFRKDGSLIWIYLSLSPIKRKGMLPIYYIAVVHDITELKEKEFELEKLSLIAKQTVNLVIITNLERNIEWVNEAFTTVTGYEANEAIGKTTDQLLHGEMTSAKVKKYINEQISLKQPFECQIVKYNKQGNKFWVDIKAQPMLNKDGEVTHYFYIETDITERKLAFRKLKKKEAKIRYFAHQLNNLLEEERTRIAREIHDEFGQQLSGLKMSLSALERSGNVKENQIIKDILAGVEQSIQLLRKISTELRPSILDTMGLIPSLEWLMTEFQKKSGIKCKCKIPSNIKPLERNTATCIFRICQEALTNISKHAAATEVELNITKMDGGLIFTVCDNGIGINNSKSKKPFSLGILNMQERASLINADIKIVQGKEKGTCVIIKLKY